MTIVGYLYNKNGMATWCIEAALALHQAGEEVILIKSSDIILPESYPVKVIDFDNEVTVNKNRSTLKKITDKLIKYWQLLPVVPIAKNFLPALHNYLQTLSINPKYYLLNQTSFVNKNLATKQYVVAWTYQPFLKDYLRKAFLLADGLGALQSNLYNAFYWHKIDWQGYTDATGVMAVSKKLSASLQLHHIKSSAVYPGTSNNNVQIINKVNSRVTLAVMALGLDESRKGLRKIIECLKKMQPYQFKLVLIGGCSTQFKNWVLENDFPATFTGLLSRQKAVEVLQTCDVLLFGSLVDDWGFVQVEAMANGMAILSPNASPFDEIVGRADYLYDANDLRDLENKLAVIISNKLIIQDKNWFMNRHQEFFSSKAFSNFILQSRN